MITYIILGTFLLGTLTLGLWAGKDVKTMKDYVLANRSLSTAVVTMSLIATFIGAGDLQHPDYLFRVGIIDMIVPACYTISFLLIGWLIVPNMVYFSDCLTTGDLMHKFYGRSAGIFTGVVNFLFSLLIISTQLRALWYIGSYLNLSAEKSILVIGSIVVLYTILSGIRGVAYTDVLQLIAIIAVLILITNMLMYKIGGLKALFQQLPAEKLSIFNNPKSTFSRSMQGGIFWGLVPTYLFAPPIVNRMLMVSDKRQVKSMFFSGAFIYATIRLMLMIIGLGAIVYLNNSSSFLAKRTHNLLAYLGVILFPESKIIQILLYLGILSVLLSTVDSYLHSAGITIVHDIVKPFCDRKKIEINEIKWIKLATFLIGAMALSLAYIGSELSNYYFFGYYGAVIALNFVLLPLIIGILGVKTNKTSFLIFCITFGTSIVFLLRLDILYKHKYIEYFISISLSTLLFFISHYIINKGFVTVQRTHHTTGHKLWIPSWRGFITTLTSYIPTPAKLAKIAQRKVSNYGSEPFLFSIFFICASPIILLNIPQAPSIIHITAIVFGMAITLCCGLMLEVKWLPSLKPYFSLYWFVTLLYCLPFAGTLLFLANAESSTAIVGLTISLLLLIVCVDWKSFFTLSSLGISAGVIAYRVSTGCFSPAVSFSIGWDLMMILGGVLITGLIFSRRKERYSKTQLQKANLYAGSIAHETKNYLGTSRFAGWRINEAIQKKQLKALEQGDLYTIPKQLAEELMFLGPELEEGANQSLSKINMFMSALMENIISAKLLVTSIKACVEEALKDGYFKGKEVKKGLLLKLDNDFKAKVPEDFFKHIVYNLVKNAYWHGGATQVVITLDAAKRSLCVEDNGGGIDATSLPYIFDLFYSGESSSGIGLALVRLIVEAFGGSVHCSSKRGEGSYAKFTVYFPEL